MNQSIDDARQFNELLNVTRGVVFKSFMKFRPKGYAGQKKLVGGLLEYFDNVTTHMKESGLRPTDTAKEMRQDLTPMLFALVAEYDNGNESEVMTVTKIAGLLVEIGFKSFGIDCSFFMKPIEKESEILGQSLN